LDLLLCQGNLQLLVLLNYLLVQGTGYETAIAGRTESPVLALKLVMTFGKVAPLSVDVLYKISLSCCHTTYRLLPDTAISGENAPAALPLRFFIILGNVAPLSRDLLYKISKFPGVLSCHTTCTLARSECQVNYLKLQVLEMLTVHYYHSNSLLY
jgi:hypothetical protein